MLAFILLTVMVLVLVGTALWFGMLDLLIKVLVLIALMFICQFLFLAMLGLILKVTKEDEDNEVPKS